MADQVALAEMQVDGAGVGRAEDALALDRAEHGAVAAVDDDELSLPSRAQADLGGGGVGAPPDQAAAGAAAQLAARGKLRRPRHAGLAEVGLVGLLERPLVGRRLEVGLEDVRVGEVDDRVLDLARQQALGLAHEVLVEGVLAGDQHGPAAARPAGPAPALPEARHGARKPGDEREVELAHVDAELERAGGDHGASSPSNRRRSISRRCSGV